MKKLTDNNKEMTFLTDIGQKAHVERETKSNSNSLVAECNEKLYQIGKNVQQIDRITKESMYFGSIATHIFVTPTTQTLSFQHQHVGLKDCPEIVVSHALTDLKNRTIEKFGRKAPKKRSGF